MCCCHNTYNFNRTSIILTNRRCIKENIVETLERMRRYLWKMKPTDDYVRGYKDAKLMIDESLKKAIEYIKLLEHDVDELWEAYHDLRPSKVEEVEDAEQ